MGNLRRVLPQAIALVAAFTVGALGAPKLVPAMADNMKPILHRFGVVNCNSSSPCEEYDNAGSGVGLQSTSSKGNGLGGETKYNSTATGSAGVIGADASATTQLDMGVLGTSTRGIGVKGISSKGAGMYGYSSSNVGVQGGSSSNSGVIGFSTSGDGVDGSSTTGNGLSGSSTTGSGLNAVSGKGNGVNAVSTKGNGVNAISVNAPAIRASSGDNGVDSGTSHDSFSQPYPRSGVYGHDDSLEGGRLNVGVDGSSTYGTGVQGTSTQWVGVSAIGGGTLGSEMVPALSIVGNNNSDGYRNDLIDACAPGPSPCLSANAIFSVDGHGNVNITGPASDHPSYAVNGSCVAGCSSPTKTSPGRAVTTYSAQQTEPMVEDFGEAQLVNGRAYVRLRSDFANIIESRAYYSVFITPEGPSAGLYVVSKTSAGFAVVENSGGRSTIAFSFRIMAKPFGAGHVARLRVVRRPRLSR